MRVWPVDGGPGGGVLLSPPRNRGQGGNLNASRSGQQQPQPHGDPVLRELVAMDTLPRVPACQPPSHGAAPRVCSSTQESCGREEWARRQLGPCHQACPGRGQGPRGRTHAGSCPSFVSAHGPAAQASSRGRQLAPISQPWGRTGRPVGRQKASPLRPEPLHCLAQLCIPGMQLHLSEPASPRCRNRGHSEAGAQVVAMETIEDPVPTQWGL